MSSRVLGLNIIYYVLTIKYIILHIRNRILHCDYNTYNNVKYINTQYILYITLQASMYIYTKYNYNGPRVGICADSNDIK
jgi:hypothetical protein